MLILTVPKAQGFMLIPIQVILESPSKRPFRPEHYGVAAIRIISLVTRSRTKAYHGARVCLKLSVPCCCLGKHSTKVLLYSCLQLSIPGRFFAELRLRIHWIQHENEHDCQSCSISQLRRWFRQVFPQVCTSDCPSGPWQRHCPTSPSAGRWHEFPVALPRVLAERE